jgi:DNA-binding CsgD family transcriptional regulator
MGLVGMDSFFDDMADLPGWEAKRLFHAAEALAATATLQDFVATARRVLPLLGDGDDLSYSEMDVTAGTLRATAWFDRVDFAALLSQFHALSDDSPLWRGHPDGGPMLVSDFVDEASFRATPQYAEVLRPLGVERVLTIGFAPTAGTVVQFALLRGARREFDPASRARVDRLRPFLARCYQTALWRTWLAADPVQRARWAPADLTDRQREIGGWLAAGKTNQEIAELTGITLETVKNHVKTVIARLGAENRVGAAMRLACVCPAHIPLEGCVGAGGRAPPPQSRLH